MLLGYVDDSGNLGNGPVCVLSGWVSDARRWMLFSDAWADHLKRHGVAYVHMTETRSHNRAGQFQHWKHDDIETFLDGCACIINQHVMFGVAAILHCDAWRRLSVQAAGQNLEQWQDHYKFMYASVLQTVLIFKHRQGLSGDVSVVFDHQNKKAHRMTQHYRDVRTAAPRHLKVTGIPTDPPAFADDKTVVPLQAADLGAWHVRRLFDPTVTQSERPFQKTLQAGSKHAFVEWDEERLKLRLHGDLVYVNRLRNAENKADEMGKIMTEFDALYGVASRS